MTQSAPEHASWFELRVLAAIPRIDSASMDGFDGRWVLKQTVFFASEHGSGWWQLKCFLFSPLL